MSIETYLPTGSELLGYRIERVVGDGGTGVVYLAHRSRCPVADALDTAYSGRTTPACHRAKPLPWAT